MDWVKLYEETGNAGLVCRRCGISRQLNGRFFLAFHDDARDEQVVITDRLGSAHGYYVLREGRVAAIGTDLADLARQHSSRELQDTVYAHSIALAMNYK